MNCANHPDIPNVAFCRTCGKALCSNCARNVKGVIYCENCLAARLENTVPPNYIAPAPNFAVPPSAPPATSGGPNPALAGILAGFFPFGVGAVYTSQYAKGLAHLIIFVLLIIGMNQHGPLDTICAFAFAFFYVYQIIDSVRTAHAVLRGEPAPDPLGLGQAFGAGEKVDTSRVPMAAILLIGLGVLFLLQTVGMFEMNFERVWPLILILMGAWLFTKKWGLMGASPYRCYCARCRMRGLMGPAVLVTIGGIGLLDTYGRGWGRSWPLILIVIGVVKILQSHASVEGHVNYPRLSGSGAPPTPPGPVQPPPPPATAAPSSEVKNV